MNSIAQMNKIQTSDQSSVNVNELQQKALNAMNDDFNTPIALAQLFEGSKWVNLMLEDKEQINKSDLEAFKTFMATFTFNVLGLSEEVGGNDELTGELMNLIIDIRKTAKENKNYPLADKIRDSLNEMKIEIRDGKDGSDWKVKS